MGHNPDREKPFFFSKPGDAVLPDGEGMDYPVFTSNLHHEIELVLALGEKGSNVAVESALDLIYGYAVGIDLTRRDLQAEAKKKGRPWDIAKGFDNSAPISELHPVSEIGHPAKGRIWLSVNGQMKQEGDLQDLIWSIPEIVAELSRYYTLCPGDLIFTGTPAGVGAVVAGDVMEGGIDGVGSITTQISAL